jgi:hypothetical protein
VAQGWKSISVLLTTRLNCSQSGRGEFAAHPQLYTFVIGLSVSHGSLDILLKKLLL